MKLKENNIKEKLLFEKSKHVWNFNLMINPVFVELTIFTKLIFHATV